MEISAVLFLILQGASVFGQDAVLIEAARTEGKVVF